MTDKELMQQTLYTLEHFYENGYDREDCFAAIAALCERLAQPEQSPLDRMAENARELGLDYEPQQEPVVYLDEHLGAFYWPREYKKDVGFTPLYTTPPRREWVGLTEEEIEFIYADTGYNDIQMFARAIEAKLKEKNA